MFRQDNQTANALSKRAWLKAVGRLSVGAWAAACRSLASAAAAGRDQTARKGLIRARRSPWFTVLEDRHVRCDLCPKNCRLAPGRRGPCRVRENRNGAGYTLVYGTPVILQTDPVERKPFYHVLPASRSLSVATAGCNFSCKFCQVWDMALAMPEEVHAYEAPPEAVVEHALNAGARSVAYTFGEPTAFFEYMLDTARLAHQAGLLNLLHSNGYINPEPLKRLCGRLDGANIDLKGFEDDFYRNVCDGELAPVLATLKTLRSAGVHTEITTLLIPTLNDQSQTIRRMCRWIKNELGSGTPLHFSRFYPLFQLANLPPTPVATLEKARDTALDEGLEYVYIANVPGHAAEKTDCPGCGKRVIDRIGFVVVETHVAEGRCVHCGRGIPGIWQ